MRAWQVPRGSAVPRRPRTTTGRCGRPAAALSVGRIGPPQTGEPKGVRLTAMGRVRLISGSRAAWGGIGR